MNESTDITNDSGVYLIVNVSNGKRYVGSSIHMKRRWQEHLSALRNGRHSNTYLQYEFDLYGEENFRLHVLEFADCKEELFQKEQHYLMAEKLYDKERGYNISRNASGGGFVGSDNGSYGKSPEQRMSYEGYAKFVNGRKNAKPMLGRSHSEESRKKMSESHKGKLHTEEWKQKHGEMLKGRKISEEQKKQIRKIKLEKASKRDMPVICIETGIVYKSMGAAAREYNVKTSSISQCIKGKSKSCGGMHWKLSNNIK